MKTTYSARVMRFRRGVYGARGRITPGAQVLLLRLSDDMNANGVVSIPRSQLAEEFGCDPSRITEWIKQARNAGYLDVVRRARPKVTAVYAGLYVAPEVRQSAPHPEVRKTAPDQVREGAPLNGPQRCARAVPQEGDASRGTNRPPSVAHPDDKRSNEKPVPRRTAVDVTDCDFHPWQQCPSDCRNADRRAS